MVHLNALLCIYDHVPIIGGPYASDLGIFMEISQTTL